MGSESRRRISNPPPRAPSLLSGSSGNNLSLGGGMSSNLAAERARRETTPGLSSRFGAGGPAGARPGLAGRGTFPAAGRGNSPATSVDSGLEGRAAPVGNRLDRIGRGPQNR